jgi:hypothetical protein
VKSAIVLGFFIFFIWDIVAVVSQKTLSASPGHEFAPEHAQVRLLVNNTCIRSGSRHLAL